MKTCVLCGAEKNDDDFYPADKKCKECRKEMVRSARAKNAEHYREFDRNRAMRPDRVEARKKYQQTEAGKASLARTHKKYAESFPERRRAQHAVSNALRDGRLQKLPCWCCDALDVEAHHPDYSSPLDVVWLCNKHHKEAHSNNK